LVKLVGETSRRKTNAISSDFEAIPISESILMSESILTTAEPASKAARMSAHNLAQTGPADLRMLAQVEKWMAMIREINREHQSQPVFQR